MTFGVWDEIWLVAAGAVVLNFSLTMFVSHFTAQRAYKRGYQAAQIANEALALGRLMETSRERYYAGDALARALEEGRLDDTGA